MVGVAGVDKERSDEEPERSEGNPNDSEQSHFLPTQKIIKAKRKSNGGTNQRFVKADACFLLDCSRFEGKKNGRGGGI
ncbi:MAG: hypothetical protein E7057_02290 [Lentisphaerae bacterium]|nr:hypothetical protein [Lentisphaerota bacterium]